MDQIVTYETNAIGSAAQLCAKVIASRRRHPRAILMSCICETNSTSLVHGLSVVHGDPSSDAGEAVNFCSIQQPMEQYLEALYTDIHAHLKLSKQETRTA
jgi:hypothetical protein